MAVKPWSMSNMANSGNNSGDTKLEELIANVPVSEVFYKDKDGKIKGTGIRVLENNTILAPNNFGVESGSINFGDLITLSEASGYLGLLNHLNNKQYQMVDYYVPRDKPSSDPAFFRLIEAEYRAYGTTDDSTVITSNPLSFNYTTKLNARTNSLVITAASPMKNVRIKMTAVDSGVTLKYLPTKAAWLGEEEGYDFDSGENIIDFLDSPLPLSAGTALHFEVVGDNISIMGSAGGIPALSAYVQRGELVDVATAMDITPEKIVEGLVTLKSPNKLPKSAVQDAVLSVNGNYGDVVISNQTLNSQPYSETLTAFSQLPLDPNQIFVTDDDGNLHLSALSQYSQSLLNLSTSQAWHSMLQLGDVAGKDVGGPGGVVALDDNGKLPVDVIPPMESLVTSVNGEQGEIHISYEDVGAAPVDHRHSIEQVDGLDTEIEALRTEIAEKESRGSQIDYSRLINVPEAVRVEYPVTTVNSKTGDVTLTAEDLGAAEEVHSHEVSDVNGLREELDNKINRDEKIPYSSLSGTPNIPTVSYPVTSVNSKTGSVSLTASDVGAATTNHGHKISDVTGLQTALDNKISVGSTIPYNTLSGTPTIPSAQIQSDWNQTNASALDFIKNKPTINYPVSSVNGKTGNVVLSSTDTGSAPAQHTHNVSDVNGLQAALDNKMGKGDTIAYSAITGTPSIPNNTNQLTNGSGFITVSQAPVQSVNGRTGDVVLTASDIKGGAAATQLTKYFRSDNTQPTGVKVKWYTVTSDANSAWTLALGTDFTEILDVQVTAISTSSAITGIRNASLNAWTAKSTSLSGMTYGSNLILSILVGGAQGLAPAPNTTIRVRVEGLSA